MLIHHNHLCILKHNLKNSHAIPIFLTANGFTMSKFKIDDMNIPYHYLSLLALIWPLLLTEVYIYSNHSLVLVSVTNQSPWLSHSITLSYLKFFL